MYENVSLNISIPIFNNYQAKTSIERSKINIQSAKLDLINIKNNLRKKIEQAYTDLLAAKKEYDANIKQLESLDQNLDVFCYDEQTESASVLEIIRAESDMATIRRSENDLVTIKYGKSPTSNKYAIILISSEDIYHRVWGNGTSRGTWRGWARGTLLRRPRERD